MRTADLPPTLTARVFLFEGLPSDDALGQLLREDGVLGAMGTAMRRLSSAGREAATEQIAAITGGLLELNLVDMLVGGWRKLVDLRDAARRTAAAPGSREVVQLATHRITSTHEPCVDLFVDELKLGRVQFALSVELVVEAAIATVGDGLLLDLRAGHCEVSMTFGAEGRQLVTRRGQVDLPGVVRLGTGVQLLEPASQT